MYPQRTAVQWILNSTWKANVQELHSFYKNSWGAIPPVKLHQIVNGFQGQDSSSTEISDQLHFQCQFTASHHLLTQPLCTPLPQLFANLKAGHTCSHQPHCVPRSLSKVPPWRSCTDSQKWKDWEGVLKDHTACERGSKGVCLIRSCVLNPE